MALGAHGSALEISQGPVGTQYRRSGNITDWPSDVNFSGPRSCSSGHRYDANTDLNMTVLKMVGKDGSELGMFNWFAVHGTSMNNTNLLVSGDNKVRPRHRFNCGMVWYGRCL